MSDATTSTNMSPGLVMVAERARKNPGERILALARFIDEGSARTLLSPTEEGRGGGS